MFFFTNIEYFLFFISFSGLNLKKNHKYLQKNCDTILFSYHKSFHHRNNWNTLRWAQPCATWVSTTSRTSSTTRRLSALSAAATTTMWVCLRSSAGPNFNVSTGNALTGVGGHSVHRLVKREKLCWGRSRRSGIRLKHRLQICLLHCQTTTLQSDAFPLWTSSPSHPDTTQTFTALKWTMCFFCDTKFTEVLTDFSCTVSKEFYCGVRLNDIKMHLFVKLATVIIFV